MEIDRTKAFTWAFNQISKIPIFNAFDSWKAWDGTLDINKLSSLTLYKVEVLKGNMFFNKKINIIYGVFLRKMDLSNIKIIYYKQPSYIHKVNYKVSWMNFGKRNLETMMMMISRLKRKLLTSTLVC